MSQAVPTGPLRRDLALISSLIRPGSRVLDLGCGDGGLLRHLMSRRGCAGSGVEIDPDAVLSAIRAGVPVIELDIDQDLVLFADQSYDAVVLSRTLQAVHRPREVLLEMARIAPRVIVSMPNFAYWRNRLRLLAGNAPVSKDLPHSWYDSPNVHFGSLDDLERLFDELGLTVIRCLPLTASGRRSPWPDRTRNWVAGAALYELTAVAGG
ncbi:MAG: methionine biosynthesis protein MetW [Propionibacteriaceae bacterium]|jgi:methionine biosynthesis protein MetW|nr:methionine biosynthesis protein MetW [Propionibacteriaceae bacterium]